MYHLRGVTLSFTMRKWHIYEYLFARPLPREGVGRGCLLTLHLNSLSSNELHRTVKFFYLLQLFNDTISMHPEMYHHSLLRTFIVWNIGPIGNMFVFILFFVERLQDYRITPLFMRSSSGELFFPLFMIIYKYLYI